MIGQLTNLRIERVDPTLEGFVAKPILDPDVYEETLATVGPEALQRLLGMLASQLQERLSDTDETTEGRSRLLRDAPHALASTSGLLGFRRFSGSCRELEQHISEDLKVEELLGRLKKEREDVLACIERMRRTA